VGGSRARNHLIVLAAEPVAKDLRALVQAAGRDRKRSSAGVRGSTRRRWR